MASFIEPIQKVIYDTIKTLCNLNMENKCDKSKVKKQFTVISNLIYLQLSSLNNKPTGKAMTMVNQVYEKEKKTSRFFILVLKPCHRIKKNANEFI